MILNQCSVCHRKTRWAKQPKELFPGAVIGVNKDYCGRCYDRRMHGTKPRPAPRPRTFNCEGGCGRTIRRRGIKLTEAPGTLKDSGSGKCQSCRTAKPKSLPPELISLQRAREARAKERARIEEFQRTHIVTRHGIRRVG